jgi:hypothetical protein
LQPATARADVSSWLYTGMGPVGVWDENGYQETLVTLQLETGLGTDPSGGIIFGGLARLQPQFGRTTDLALLVRSATHGYVNGDWGLALDLGAYHRLTEREIGPTGSLVLGAPWGITLSATGGLEADRGFFASATLGLDFARLTVYRTTGYSWWRNTFPAYRPDED